jgi:hypothetical protein
MSCTRNVIAALLSSGFFAAALPAQEDPVNVEKVASWDGYGGYYADVYGQPGYAFVAQWYDNGVLIVDLSDPAAPTLLKEYSVGSPNQYASAQDVEVHDGLMYIGLDSDGNDSAIIVDVRDPANPVQLTRITINSLRDVHELNFDSGWLYLADSRSNHVAIVDLTAYDPDDPPAQITKAAYIVNNIGNEFVHSVLARHGRMYCSAWGSGLWVYDVSDLANTEPRLLGKASGRAVHSCWPTDDRRYVLLCEERRGGPLRIFEMIDQEDGTLALEFRDEYKVTTNRAISVHNVMLVGYRAFCAWYQIGLQVFDLDPATGELRLIGSYDTTSSSGSGGYDGAWGVYPYNGQDQVLISDIQTGLWVLDLGYLRGDLNCDRGVDFGDIDAFVVALTGQDAYEQQYPDCEFSLADINCDGGVDFSDIDGFVTCLTNGYCEACP